ncbi:MAG: hypothetical protein NTV51_25745 [Verrucomicrobia bacterium]|nr:hypothetical protein [Verrucomicrobiota bacterium]
MRKLSPWIFVALWSASVGVAKPDELAEAIVLTPQGGTTVEDQAIAAWQSRASVPAANAEAWERLGWAYVAKARRTLDAGFFKLAEKTADASDARFGVRPEMRLLRGHVLHNLHRFREAETVARGLFAERGLAVDLALLSDALVEQGKLGETVEVLQRMVDLRPGAEAFSRIAHVRWLKGDLAGATGAMEAALRARDPRESETYAWTLVRLSGYYLQDGRTEAALTAADAAVKHAADYAPALLARGRALLATGRGDEAVGALWRAAELNPLPEYHWWLADTLRAAGRETEAVQTEERLSARGDAGDPRTLALFLATRGVRTDRAVRLAREELDNRADVLTHDALAWALAANGELAAAETEMNAALAEQTKDARLFLHAGEIALARGHEAAARAHFADAKRFSGSLTPSERARLASRLEAAAPTARAD